MKINPLDAHDRFQHFTSQQFDIAACCQDLIDKRPFGDVPFYIFAHARTDDDGTTKRLIWQPRLTKPKAQTNSMLFKAYPGTDIVKVIWMIPERHLWSSFKSGNMMANKTILQSIEDFETNRTKLEAKESDDLTDEQIDKIYEAIAMDAKIKRRS